jgi:hypothetical protein
MKLASTEERGSSVKPPPMVMGDGEELANHETWGRAALQ